MLTIKQFFKKYGVLSTTNFDLLKIAKELKIKKFYCCMKDELKEISNCKKFYKVKSKTLPIYIVCNYQSTINRGTHWVALYKDIQNSYYFDSYGIDVIKEAIDFLGHGIYNTFKIQKLGEEYCGQISLYVLYCLYNGKDFYDTVLYLKNELQ